MDTTYSIRFGRQPSQDYQSVLVYASKFRKYYPAKEGSSTHVIETTNLEMISKFDVFVKLMTAIRDWDSTQVFMNGNKLLPSEYMLEEKNEIAACYQRYLASEDKDRYCDTRDPSCWGCRILNGIILRHEKAAYNKDAKYWYQFGNFIDNATWKINREKLSSALESIAQQKNIDFCPVYEHSMFRRYMAALPMLIHMSDTRNWGYVYMEDSVNNAARWEPVNVKHIHPSLSPEEKNKADDLFILKTKDERSSDAQNLRYVPSTTFADIGGVDEIIQNIRIMIELPIKKPMLFEQLGVQPFRGILLWGDPGNGKTLIAKAIAHEVNAHFIPVAGPDILNKNFGQSEQNLRDIFEEARQHQPSVIFIDEIDSIAQTRLSGESAKWYATLVNQLMSLMDGVKEFGNVTVLASTNRPDLLDAALLRPGRFDYKLEIKKPNLPGCKRVLEIATRGMPLADEVDLFAFSESVVGYSAAEITFLVKEAAMVVLRKGVANKTISLEDDNQTDFSFLKITMADLETALHMLKWHRRYVNLSYSLKDKKLT